MYPMNLIRAPNYGEADELFWNTLINGPMIGAASAPQSM
jgi:hypothetical protein